MSVTKDSFRDWKANPVTKAVFQELVARVVGIQKELVDTAGIDPLQDRYRTGAARAYNDILDIDFDEVTNDN